MYILSTPLVLNTKILAKRLFVSRLFVWGNAASSQMPTMTNNIVNAVSSQSSINGIFQSEWGSVLLIIFYVENLDVGSWGVKNDV